jgi:hypothetical protein
MSDLQTRKVRQGLGICSLTVTQFLAMAASAGAVSQDALYQALLKAPLPTTTSRFTSAQATPVPQKVEGLVGEVDVVFQGNDPKARIGLFVFADRNAASEFNHKQMPPLRPGVPGYKLLAYPPLARCVEIPEKGGYCDMWIQDYSVIMVASASKEDDAAELMGFGFKYLSSVYGNLAQQPAPPPKPGGISACSLVTQDEVESAMRQRMASPEPDKVGGCNWRGSGDGLTVQVFDTGQAGFNAARSHSVGTMTFPGIGDDAFGFVSLAGFVQINLIKNGHYVAITLQSQRDPSKLETAKTLAQKIAGRL